MSKLIKVCHITSAHKPDDVRIYHKECVSLANAGYSVFLVAPNCKDEIINGVHIYNADAPVSGRLTRMINTSRIVYEKALSLESDIYHFHDPELLPYGLKLKRKGKIVIYDAHEDLPKQILGKYWINKYLRKIISVILRIYENYISKRLDYIITATPYIRDRFIKVNPACTDINNYPLLSELFSNIAWAEKKNEICYIGGISLTRGINQLIDAMENVGNCKLNIAGNYSPENLREEIVSKPGWEKVNEFGFVSRNEIIEILSRSKIGMVTLQPTQAYLDSLPIKMFEYMAAGIPVIASNFPLWRSIIENNKCGICVDPENPEAITKAVINLLKNDLEAEQLGKNGRSAVIEKYNWTVEEKKLLLVYNKLCSGS